MTKPSHWFVSTYPCINTHNLQSSLTDFLSSSSRGAYNSASSSGHSAGRDQFGRDKQPSSSHSTSHTSHQQRSTGGGHFSQSFQVDLLVSLSLKSLSHSLSLSLSLSKVSLSKVSLSLSFSLSAQKQGMTFFSGLLCTVKGIPTFRTRIFFPPVLYSCVDSYVKNQMNVCGLVILPLTKQVSNKLHGSGTANLIMMKKGHWLCYLKPCRQLAVL